MTRNRRYIAVLAFTGLVFNMGIAAGKTSAVRADYAHCFDNWMGAMERHLADPNSAPYDDWPGRSQCYHRVIRIFGEHWGSVVPKPQPMDPRYLHDDY